MGTVIKNRGTSCVGVRKTGTTLIHVSTVMGTLYIILQLEKLILMFLNLMSIHFTEKIQAG